MSYTTCPGPCDNGVRGSGKYLCLGCWSGLPMPARRALNRRGPAAIARLQELYAQLAAGIPLADVRISP